MVMGSSDKEDVVLSTATKPVHISQPEKELSVTTSAKSVTVGTERRIKVDSVAADAIALDGGMALTDADGLPLAEERNLQPPPLQEQQQELGKGLVHPLPPLPPLATLPGLPDRDPLAKSGDLVLFGHELDRAMALGLLKTMDTEPVLSAGVAINLAGTTDTAKLTLPPPGSGSGACLKHNKFSSMKNGGKREKSCTHRGLTERVAKGHWKNVDTKLVRLITQHVKEEIEITHICITSAGWTMGVMLEVTKTGKVMIKAR